MKVSEKSVLHKSTHLVGWINDNRHRSPFYVEVELRNTEKGDELSICGTWAGGGGQCDDKLGDVSEFFPGWDAALRDRLLETWRRWHLNGLRHRCEHQRAVGEDPRKLDPRTPCAECGHKPGEAWMHEPLPPEVREFVRSLPNGSKSSPYDIMAREFLADYGFTVTFRAIDRTPDWGGTHGDGYRVTIRRQADGKRLSFDWWNCQADIGKAPRPYSVLSCVASDAGSPTDPDEVAQEYGDMKPSTAVKVAQFAKRLQSFFTEDELAGLAEIQ